MVESFRYQSFISQHKILSAGIKYINGLFYLVLANETDDHEINEISAFLFDPKSFELVKEQHIQLKNPNSEYDNYILIKMNKNPRTHDFYAVYRGRINRFYKKLDCFYRSTISSEKYFIDCQAMENESIMITKDNFLDINVFDLEAQKEYYSVENLLIKNLKVEESSGVFGLTFNKTGYEKEVRIYNARLAFLLNRTRDPVYRQLKHIQKIDKFDFCKQKPYVAVTEEESEIVYIYDLRYINNK